MTRKERATASQERANAAEELFKIKEQLTSQERATAADELFGIKDQLTDNSYITIMNLLSGKKTTPDFERAKFVRLKRHVFRYHQTYYEDNRTPLPFHHQDMDISVETHLLNVHDDADNPISLCDCGNSAWCGARGNETISREYLREVYDIYTQQSDCGNCHYIKHYRKQFWRPVEVEIVY